MGLDNVVGLIRNLMHLSAAVGDVGDDGAVPSLWSQLPKIVVVGGQVHSLSQNTALTVLLMSSLSRQQLFHDKSSQAPHAEICSYCMLIFADLLNTATNPYDRLLCLCNFKCCKCPLLLYHDEATITKI